MADTPDLGEIISKLTEDPEMMGKVMGLASSLMGSIPQDNAANPPIQDESSPREGAESKPSFDPSMLSALLGGLNGAVGSDKKDGGGKGGDSRAALLMALKPYMSEDRAEKIDMMIKALKLADVAGNLLGNSGLFR